MSMSMTQDRQNVAWASMPLDEKQVGHIRHIRNLAGQLPDDWSGMLGPSTMQEDFGSLRFQLAYMSYALALAHVHRLPAAPAVFRKSFDNLIQKMLSPDVWTYWHYVSTGGFPLNMSLGDLPATWDPVGKDNIMYSAYVQSMALLYHYLFDDDKYAKEGALTFSFSPLYWGKGGQSFSYDERSLNDRIYWQMVENGYLGVACEPNCIFQICNQPPILGFRLHDLIYGGDVAVEVTEGYKRAWADFGIINEAGHFNMMVQERERQVYTPDNAPWVDFWLGTLMHMWNADFVEEKYPRQKERWVKEGPDGTLWVPPVVPENPDHARLTTAREHGWAAACAAELGDQETLVGLLNYADEFLNPTWKDGGYYYPRRDQWHNDAGRLAAMDPHTGNALLSLARLNVPDGFQALYETPWDRSRFEQPALVEIQGEADVFQAYFEPDQCKLYLVLGSSQKQPTKVRLAVSKVWERGKWTIFRDSEQCATGTPLAVVEGDRVGARRDGDLLRLEFELSSASNFMIEWMEKT